MIEILLVSVALVLFAFALFGIRLLLIKNSQFRGTCAGNSPYLKKDGIACGICGAKPGEECAKDEKEKITSQSPG